MLPDLLGSGTASRAFWARLSRSSRRFLGLDYDGTLAPFQVRRMEACPASGAVAALEAVLRTQTEVAVISGRLLDEVLQLLGDPGITIVGSHGYEWRHGDGRRETVPLAPAQQRALSRAADELAQLSPAPDVEHKVASLAVHTRGLERPAAIAVQEQAAEIFERLSGQGPAEERVMWRPFDGGVELRAEGMNKGRVLHRLLGDEATDEESLAVYLGDDTTDEDAFVALQSRGGVGVKVGASGGPTAASFTLRDPAAVVLFLQRWVSF